MWKSLHESLVKNKNETAITSFTLVGRRPFIWSGKFYAMAATGTTGYNGDLGTTCTRKAGDAGLGTCKWYKDRIRSFAGAEGADPDLYPLSRLWVSGSHEFYCLRAYSQGKGGPWIFRTGNEQYPSRKTRKVFLECRSSDRVISPGWRISGTGNRGAKQ
ncbi:hypothetical protein D3C81_1392380 [compost metagenome]